MSSNQGRDPNKKHRHDVGVIDHGPESTAAITRSIQFVLGAAILGSAALTVYALVLAST